MSNDNKQVFNLSYLSFALNDDGGGEVINTLKGLTGQPENKIIDSKKKVKEKLKGS